jgi:formylglycine-generating enzyme required for sulfatase activity
VPLSLNSARLSWARIVFAAFFAAFATLPTAGFGQSGKLKQPEQAAVAKEVAVVKSTFEREIQEAANDESAATKLVYELLSKVSATPDAEGKWALLKVAQEIAEEASGSIDAALKCVTDRAALFDIDLAKERNAVLKEFSKPKPPANAQLFGKAMEASREALASEKFPEAREAAEIAADVAKALLKDENDLARQIRKQGKGKVKPPAPEAEENFVLPAARLVKRILEAESLSNASRAAEAVLRTSPDDMAAQASVGEYKCFLKAAWADGLPLMAKNRNSTAADIAAAELRARDPVDTTKLLEVADKWWELAKTGLKDSEVKREAVQRHAIDIYTLVLPNLKKPLDEKRAKDRMAELGRSLPPQRQGDRDQNVQAGQADNPLAMRNGQIWKNSLGMELVLLPTGKYASHKMAGYQKGDAVEVQITKEFLICRTEVTQSQWTNVMKSEPWKGQKDTFVAPNCPATYVTWQEAVDFCATLTKREREAGTLPATLAYRLPTESQWEYACRAGTTSDFSFGDEKRVGEYVWELYATVHNVDPDQSYAHEVAKKKPNPWGLFDTHGNVKEWCLDWDGEFSGGEDPQGPPDGTAKICRGGAWHHGPLDCRSLRNPYDRANPSERSSGVGFRVVLERTPDAAQGPPSDPVANRVAAEWGLGLKANIEIETADRKRQRVDSPANLPASPFVVVSINLPPDAGVKPSDLRVLKPLNRLEGLGFGGNPITDELFDHISDLPSLKGLGANWTGVTGAGLARLKNARLVGIDVGGVKNIMPALQRFKAMGTLESINFDRVDIPKEGFAILAEMKTLKQLWFRKGLISDDDLNYLKQQLPSCNISLHQ